MALKCDIRGKQYLVEYNYTQGRAGIRTLRNGDPGWPDEPDEVEVLWVRYRGRDLKRWPAWLDDAIYERVCDFEDKRKYDEMGKSASRF